MDTNTTQEGTAKALVLPKAAQDAIVAGISQAIEALMGLGDLARQAQVTEDAGAVVPPEFASSLTQIGMMLAAMGDQYAGGGGVEIEIEAPEGMTPEQMGMAKELAKSLASKLAKGIGPVSKGRVKMSWDQMMKLQSGLMAKLYEIASELAPLVSEGGAEMIESMKPGAAETQKAAPSAPAAPAAPSGTTPAADPVAVALQRIEKNMGALSDTVGKIAKTRQPPNGSPSPEGGGSAPDFRIPYGVNLSAQIAQQQKTTEGSSGAR